MTAKTTRIELKLEHAFDLRLSFGEEMRLGATSLAHTRVFHAVTGGTVWGPRLKGEVIPGSGSDAPSLTADRAVLGGEWLIRAHDGTLILMKNAGFALGAAPNSPWRADVPELVQPSLRLAPIFEAPDGAHAWLNRTVFVGKGDRRRTDATIRIFAVM
jgi:Protein of unknown function (DUF3237)